MTRRVLQLIVAVAFLVVGPASTAYADPVGPTDYRSEIVSVEPESDALTVEVIGGDAFLQVSVMEGANVEVTGYRGEPYLRFLPDGTVEVNDNAPSTYLSEDRFGETEVPDTATPEADPSWRQVSVDGAYAWHDHRAHWMNEARPAAQPGEQILEAVVPVSVDGVDTTITVVSFWEVAPSPLLPVAGAGVGLVAAWLWGRRLGRSSAVLLAVTGLVAGAVAFVAYLSVPAVTAPSPVYWLVPLVAVAVALIRVGRPESDVLTTLAVPTVLLVAWALLRHQWMLRAILPTPIPGLDRFVTGAVLGAGTLVAVMAVRSMLGAGPGSSAQARPA